MKKESDRLADTLDRVNHAPPQAVLGKLYDRIENLTDARDQDEKFLSVYLPLSDMLIDTLAENAIKSGYRNALETLKGIRADFCNTGFHHVAPGKSAREKNLEHCHIRKNIPV